MSRNFEASATLNPLERSYQPVLEPLQQVRQALAEQLASDDPDLAETCRWVCNGSGKLLRPALLLLSARVLDTVSARHVALAAAVELLHLATLVHDDVIDESQTRRGQPTARAIWDNQTSVLLGDMLLCKAFGLCNRAGSLEAFRVISDAAEKTCRGEMVQSLKRRDWTLTEATYLDIIEKKTASFYRMACELGGRLSNADADQLRALQQYGRCLGTAFQISDDLLDLTGTEQATGKTVGTDIAQGKATLPVVHALSQLPADDRADLLNVLDGAGAPDEIRPFLERTDSIQYTHAKARRFGEQAAGWLITLPAGQAREALAEIADFVAERSY